MDVLTGLRGGYILGVSDGYVLNLPLVGYAVGSSKHFPLSPHPPRVTHMCSFLMWVNPLLASWPLRLPP